MKDKDTTLHFTVSGLMSSDLSEFEPIEREGIMCDIISNLIAMSKTHMWFHVDRDFKKDEVVFIANRNPHGAIGGVEMAIYTATRIFNDALAASYEEYDD
jgi:hypothetical protein